MKTTTQLNILKTISILLIWFTFLPFQKFSIPYIFGVVMTLIERFSELNFTIDLLVNLVCLLGAFLIFFNKKLFVLFGYLAILFPFAIYFCNASYNKLDVLFYVPFLLFIGSASLVLFYANSNK